MSERSRGDASDIDGQTERSKWAGAHESKRGQQTSFKSLLILIKSGDICRSVCFILIRMTYQARAKLLRSASLVIERVN
jgi:hypothetical protein